MKTIAVLLATLTPALVAAYGESCSYYSGSKFGTIKGICGSPGECEYDALGYPVNDRCPGVFPHSQMIVYLTGKQA
ncbi:hypothetical protein HK097_001255 [Rhizophlyctis rosea]|uniref:Uncharacterized protein n=1 Tax=Rhizophlyctis rosea TaxID=64517 RepID=A0AAD5WYF7_9FUNG|nr:hypothetical protein HK097_001255 [Rhizophlyctis rosea]